MAILPQPHPISAILALGFASKPNRIRSQTKIIPTSRKFSPLTPPICDIISTPGDDIAYWWCKRGELPRGWDDFGLRSDSVRFAGKSQCQYCGYRMRLRENSHVYSPGVE